MQVNEERTRYVITTREQSVTCLTNTLNIRSGGVASRNIRLCGIFMVAANDEACLRSRGKLS